MSSDFRSDRVGGGMGSGFSAPGPGAFQNFMCQRCSKPEMLLGRRKVAHRGAKVWACRDCAQQGAAK
jgi:hypothetical protein